MAINYVQLKNNIYDSLHGSKFYDNLMDNKYSCGNDIYLKNLVE